MTDLEMMIALAEESSGLETNHETAANMNPVNTFADAQNQMTLLDKLRYSVEKEEAS